MSNTKEFSQDNWKETVLGADKPVLVDFWAPWCGPCRSQGPLVDQLAEELGDKAVIGKVNVEEHPDVAAKYGITGIPTLLIFRQGKVAEEFVGLTQVQEMKKALVGN